jgi:3-hydroxyisobutyrate dehydrogenase-like beta-hydroxyacid dehydrogenase
MIVGQHGRLLFSAADIPARGGTGQALLKAIDTLLMLVPPERSTRTTRPLQMDTIGIIGAGALAGAITDAIAARSRLRIIVHGVDLVAPHNGRVSRAPNLFDLASECQAIISVYDSHADLRCALTGDADRPGLLGAMAPGALLLDLGAGTPEEARRLAGALVGAAVGYVDGVVTGSMEAVRAGSAHIVVGGFVDHIVELTPALQHVGQVTRAGSQGQARLLCALVHAVHAGRRALLDEVMQIATGSDLSGSILQHALETLADGTLPDGGHDDLINIAATAARSTGVDAPLIAAVAARSLGVPSQREQAAPVRTAYLDEA